MHTHPKSCDPAATIGLDIGKNMFHLVGLDKRGAIAIRIKLSRNQLARQLSNLPRCLVGLEAGSGSHHIALHVQARRSADPARLNKCFPSGSQVGVDHRAE